MHEQSSGNIQTIGKYRIVGTLGRGSMGIVYKGQDPGIGRFVAIKTLRKIFSTQFHDLNAAIERFKAEARSAGNLRHPNIITIFDVNIEGDMPYIVMDYVEGEGLDQLIARHVRLDPEVALGYLADAAEGLDYAHLMNVIHRDVKPSNILVDRLGRVVLLDFGIASINETFSEGDKNAGKGPIMGTPGYMSPEQILNQSLDHRSDLFSFAVVAFECLTGKRPFPGDNFTAVVSSILNSKPLSLTSLAPELPLALEEAFEKALARQREDRFKSAGEMIASFRAALGVDVSPRGMHSVAGRAAGRRKKASTWRSFQVEEEPVQEMAQAEVSAPIEESTPPAQDGDYHPVWGWSGSSPDLPRRTGESGRPGETPGERLERLAGEDVRMVPLHAGLSMNFMRFMTVFMAACCVLLAVFLLWTLLGGEKSPPYSRREQAREELHAGRRMPEEGHKPSVVGPGADLEELIMPDTAPVPANKTVEEMADKELLGVIVDEAASETLLVNALREGIRRKVAGLSAACLVPLGSDSYVVRVEAIKVLAQLGDKRVVPRLVLALDDFDPIVRRHTALALGALGSRHALAYLSIRLKLETVPEVRGAIRQAIDSIRGFASTE